MQERNSNIKIMKRILNKLFPIIPLAVILGSTMFSHSCANTQTPPSGGPKDTIPPVIEEIYPAIGQINAFEQDLTIFRGIMRADYKVRDEDAFVNGYIQPSA